MHSSLAHDAAEANIVKCTVTLPPLRPPSLFIPLVEDKLIQLLSYTLVAQAESGPPKSKPYTLLALNPTSSNFVHL
jgi:hypothetical protein